MADQKNPDQPKTLEMRVAELEDKLTKMQVTEDEIKAYQKVAALVGGGAGALSPQVCTVARCIVSPGCIINPICIIRCIINPVCECFECGGCGPCAPAGGTAAGGFGTLGR